MDFGKYADWHDATLFQGWEPPAMRTVPVPTSGLIRFLLNLTPSRFHLSLQRFEIPSGTEFQGWKPNKLHAMDRAIGEGHGH
jgi:hypothetical protein